MDQHKEKHKSIFKEHRKRKYKKKKPKKRATYKTKFTDPEKAAKILFDSSKDDLKCISENKDLLKLHKQYITKVHYSRITWFAKWIKPVTCSEGDEITPQYFVGFAKLYPTIFERWSHLIKSCYDSNYMYYKFIGAKGIRVCKEFLDSKSFCLWCLKNALVSKLGMYMDYFVRHDKSKDYTLENCYVTTESDVHTGKSMESVLASLILIKNYNAAHHEDVSYMTAYTRFYVWDFNVDDSINYSSGIKNSRSKNRICFSPEKFYQSVATENSCTYSTFKSRLHYCYLNGGLTVRPYDMLDPNYSISAAANANGKLSYKQKWHREWKEKMEKNKIYNNPDEVYQNDLTNTDGCVYNTTPETNVYSK